MDMTLEKSRLTATVPFFADYHLASHGKPPTIPIYNQAVVADSELEL